MQFQAGEEYSSYSFLNLTLDGVNSQPDAPVVLYPRERTRGTHWIRGWVGLRAGLAENSFASAADRTPVVQSLVRRYTELPQLPYV
jgi:hypothetical protein